jgi:uncharacterized coiled-coil protein SlyX
MKKLSNFLSLAFIGLCLLFTISCIDVSEKSNPKLLNKPSLTASDIETYSGDGSIDSLRKQLAEYKRIVETQNGVCDDCVAGFSSVLIEHQSVAKKLSDEIYVMNEKLLTLEKFKAETVALSEIYQRQSAEFVNIVSLRTSLIKEHHDQIAELRKSNQVLVSNKSFVKARY